MTSWQEMIEIEPRLADLYAEAKARRRRNYETNLNAWFDHFKPRLCKLVGFDAKDPRLRSMESYDAGYVNVFWALTGEKLAHFERLLAA